MPFFGSKFPKISLTLPDKNVFYLGREQSFDKGFKVQFWIFSEMFWKLANQPSVAYKSVAYKIKSVYTLSEKTAENLEIQNMSNQYKNHVKAYFSCKVWEILEIQNMSNQYKNHVKAFFFLYGKSIFF